MCIGMPLDGLRVFPRVSNILALLQLIQFRTAFILQWGESINEAPSQFHSTPNFSSFSFHFFLSFPPEVHAQVCGNGVIEVAEHCDDGNTISGDGCNSSCTAMDNIAIVVEEDQLITKFGPLNPSLGPDFIFNTINSPGINANGAVVFFARIGNFETQPLLRNSVWVGEPGNLQLLALEGTQAPGTPVGTVFKDNFSLKANDNSFPPPIVTKNGAVAFFAKTSGGSEDGIWAGVPDDLRLIAIENGGWFNSGAGDIFTLIADFTYSDAGVAFAAQAQISGEAVTGVWAGPPGNVKLIAKQGDPSPEPGCTWNPFNLSSTNPVINPNGDIAFFASLSCDIPKNAIFAGSPDSLQRIVIRNQQAPGFAEGLTFTGTLDWTPHINGVGEVSFEANISTLPNSLNSIWLWSAGVLNLAALHGEPVPGSGGQLNYQSFTSPPANCQGILASEHPPCQ